MQLLKALLVPETYKESSTVYVPLKRASNSGKRISEEDPSSCVDIWGEEIKHSQHI